MMARVGRGHLLRVRSTVRDATLPHSVSEHAAMAPGRLQAKLYILNLFHNVKLVRDLTQTRNSSRMFNLARLLSWIHRLLSTRCLMIRFKLQYSLGDSAFP